MKKLPIAVSSFVNMRSDDYLYVDKTGLIQQLFEQGRYYWLTNMTSPSWITSKT